MAEWYHEGSKAFINARKPFCLGHNTGGTEGDLGDALAAPKNL